MSHFIVFLAMLVGTLLIGYSSTYAGIPVDGLEVIDTISSLGRVSNMVLTPNGKKLYVVNPEYSDPEHPMGSVLVIDTKTNQVVDTIGLDEGFPTGIAITPNGKQAYLAVSKASGGVTSNGSNRVEVIDTKTDTIVATIQMGGNAYGPIGVAITSNGKRVYVTHRGDGSVHVIDTASNEDIASIQVGPMPVGIAITPNGQQAYVANRNNGTVSVIDTKTNTVAETISVSIGPSRSHTWVAITPNGKRAYVTYAQDSQVAVIDTELNEEVNIIDTPGGNLKQITLISGGNLAFVNSSETDEMLIIDTNPGSKDFHTVVGSVDVGDSPFGVVSHSQSQPNGVAYVSNLDDGTVSVIGKIVGKSKKAPALNSQSRLFQNNPNPFNPETWFPYQLARPAEVEIRIYNAAGQLVRTLDLGQKPAGSYLSHGQAAYWNGTNERGESVASGLYFYQIQAGDFSAMRRMLLLK